MREIDKSALVANIESMINALEYDSMRSGGKCKINSGTLVNLYALNDIYKKQVVAAKPVAKPAAKATK